MAKMAMMGPMSLVKLCEALGVERPNEVVRVVLDIRSGHIPMLLVERMADPEKIIATLTGPGIEVRRDDPGAAVAEVTHAPVRTCACTAGDACSVPWHWTPHLVAGQSTVDSVPIVRGRMTGGNIAWGNGSVVQNSTGR